MQKLLLTLKLFFFSIFLFFLTVTPLPDLSFSTFTAVLVLFIVVVWHASPCSLYSCTCTASVSGIVSPFLTQFVGFLIQTLAFYYSAYSSQPDTNLISNWKLSPLEKKNPCTYVKCFFFFFFKYRILTICVKTITAVILSQPYFEGLF